MNLLDLAIQVVLIPIIIKLWNELEERKTRKTYLINEDGIKVERRYTRKEQKAKQEQKSEWASLGYKVAETKEKNTWKKI